MPKPKREAIPTRAAKFPVLSIHAPEFKKVLATSSDSRTQNQRKSLSNQGLMPI
jgi:hypothetical protein